MNLSDQSAYWNSVAASKVFTHPLNFRLLENFVTKDGFILDYGCGYGRSIKELLSKDYLNCYGVDTSIKLIDRGKAESLPIFHIDKVDELLVENKSCDCLLLFAVLTCIPSNKEQQKLIKFLAKKLKSGGIIYISDYYLQENTDRYNFLNKDKNNYGVFTLPEGVTLRHHKKEWIQNLLSDFIFQSEELIETTTMNGNKATIFQVICMKK